MVRIALAGVRLDALDVRRVAAFWGELLDWRVEQRGPRTAAVLPATPSSYPLLVEGGAGAKTGQNRIHLDLTTAPGALLHERAERARRLGAVDVDIGQSPDEPHVVLADPEGNELCIIAPENTFLAGTGAVGAINCDGSRALGHFWSKALDWPLVWDQDEETAIQAPGGGTKVTWSGPPFLPRPPRDRLRLAVSTPDPLEAAIAHLESLGARSREVTGPATAVLHDVDGNDFHLRSSSEDSA